MVHYVVHPTVHCTVHYGIVADRAVPLLFSCGTADPVVDHSLTKRSGEMLVEVLGDAVSRASAPPLHRRCTAAAPPLHRRHTGRTYVLARLLLQAEVVHVERAMHQPDPGEMRAVHTFIAARLNLQGV